MASGGSDTDVEIELRTLPLDLVYGLMPACRAYCSSDSGLIRRGAPAIINPIARQDMTLVDLRLLVLRKL